MGHVRALIDFDSKLARKKFAAQLTDEDRDEWWDVPKKYPAWLIREGLAEPCDEVIEFYLGSHSSSLIED